MKRITAFALHLRHKALLCCSAAVLLSACGGNIDDGTGQSGVTAAQVTADTGVTAPSAAAAAPAAAPTTDTTIPQATAAAVTPSDTTTVTPIPPAASRRQTRRHRKSN